MLNRRQPVLVGSSAYSLEVDFQVMPPAGSPLSSRRPGQPIPPARPPARSLASSQVPRTWGCGPSARTGRSLSPAPHLSEIGTWPADTTPCNRAPVEEVHGDVQLRDLPGQVRVQAPGPEDASRRVCRANVDFSLKVYSGEQPDRQEDAGDHRTHVTHGADAQSVHRLVAQRVVGGRRGHRLIDLPAPASAPSRVTAPPCTRSSMYSYASLSDSQLVGDLRDRRCKHGTARAARGGLDADEAAP